MHNHLDLKVQLLAGLVLFTAHLQQTETFLRFALLILSIVYTVYRIIDRFEEKRKKNKETDIVKDENHEKD